MMHYKLRMNEELEYHSSAVVIQNVWPENNPLISIDPWLTKFSQFSQFVITAC